MKLRHVFAFLVVLAVFGLLLNSGLGAGDKDKVGEKDKKDEKDKKGDKDKKDGKDKKGDKDKDDKDKKGDKKDLGFEIPKTGPEHKVLASLAGTFDAKVKMMDPKGGEAIESKGTIKRAMILGGRFLKEDFTGSVFGMKFQGMALVGYDTEKKKFVSTWADTMSTGIATAEGTWDESTKTLTSRGEEMRHGMKIKSKDVLKVVSNDEQHMELYKEIEGKEMKVMEIDFTRAKDMKKKEKDKKEKDK